MAHYVILSSYTDQGARNAKETTRRAAALKAMAAKKGAEVREIFWTLGHYDHVVLMEAPDDETAETVVLSLGTLGNVRTQTLRAFSAEEMDKIIGRA